ncbi:hypothetical protein LVJ94_01540 [Pendulispora rubella]|uniref:DNA-directed RNA polymerase n=1 Tax=Pendulispora rubella TaxID=2741070 RepID=A0ABZ2L4T0_9BACT
MMAPSPVACLGIFFATRAEPHPPRARAFRDRDRVLEALAHGIVTMDDTLAARHVPHGPRCVTTVGRFLVAECFPPIVRAAFPDGPWDAPRIAEALRRTIWDEHVEVAARSAEALEQLGRFVADRSGASIAQRDFAPPSITSELLAEAQLEVAEVERRWHARDIVRWEYEDKRADIWANVAARQRGAAKAAAPERDPLAALLASQSSMPKAESLRCMIGPRTLSSGLSIARPILHGLGEGLDPHEYMMRCMTMRADALTPAREARRGRGSRARSRCRVGSDHGRCARLRDHARYPSCG